MLAAVEERNCIIGSLRVSSFLEMSLQETVKMNDDYICG